MEIQTTNQKLISLSLDGVIIGVYDNLTTTIDNASLVDLIKIGSFKAKPQNSRLLFNVPGIQSPMVAVVGLGSEDETTNEGVRIAIANGIKLLRKNGANHVGISSCGFSQASAEGAVLGLYRITELKKEDPDRTTINKITFSGNEQEIKDWETGTIIADSQIKARRLGDLPANIANPSFFVKETKKYFEEVDNTVVKSFGLDWILEQKMGAFHSVAKGSDEPAKLLIIEYRGGKEEDQPLAIIGKGITFDTGGINIKSATGMYTMRGDCSGAAATIGALLGISKLKLPINVVGLAPLTENMPSGKATRPSDIVVASNGKSIEIGNTDAEGRMVLSDALVYAEKTYRPHTVIDIATLTGAMARTLGSNIYLGAFSRDEELWDELKLAGKESGEEFWRFPMNDRYKKMLKSTMADMKSTGGAAGSIYAAMFLGEFVELERWAHIDIAGSAFSKDGKGYLPKGNTGVPVRAIIQVARNSIK